MVAGSRPVSSLPKTSATGARFPTCQAPDRARRPCRSRDRPAAVRRERPGAAPGANPSAPIHLPPRGNWHPRAALVGAVGQNHPLEPEKAALRAIAPRLWGLPMPSRTSSGCRSSPKSEPRFDRSRPMAAVRRSPRHRRAAECRRPARVRPCPLDDKVCGRGRACGRTTVFALDLVLEEEPLDPPRIALEQSGHRCKPANPQQLPCMRRRLSPCRPFQSRYPERDKLK